MPSVKRFYEEGAGDRLMDPACHPPAITEFLAAEQQMLSEVADCVDVLVEVGCMDGRNLGWAVAHGKRYIGVDRVHRHIQTAWRTAEERGLHEQARFVTGDARRINTLVEPALRDLAGARVLLFFPFNSFGNMPGPARALRSIRASGLPFFISSYQPGALATACRASYYQRCGYRALAVSEDERGVWFTSPEGLRSVAYEPHYLLGLCSASGLNAAPMAWAKINQAYASPELTARWNARRYAVSPNGSRNGNGHGDFRRVALL